MLNSSCIEVSWSPPTSAQKDGNILGYMVLYSKVDDLGNQLKPPAPVDMKDSESETNLVRLYLVSFGSRDIGLLLLLSSDDKAWVFLLQGPPRQRAEGGGLAYAPASVSQK